MRKKLGIIFILLGFFVPLHVSAANADFIKYITDEYTDYFDVEYVEYDEYQNIIIARADINNKLSDKEGIESFNEGIAQIIFSDEIEQMDKLTDIMFLGYADDDDGVKRSQAVVYYSWKDIGFIRAIGLLVEKDSYYFSTYYSITDQFSQHLEDFEEAEPPIDENSIEELVNSSIGIREDEALPDVR